MKDALTSEFCRGGTDGRRSANYIGHDKVADQFAAVLDTAKVAMKDAASAQMT